MRLAVAVLLAATFVALSALHVLWAVCDTAAGAAVIPAFICLPILHPSHVPTLLVAAALALAALTVLARARLILPALPAQPVAWACGTLGVVFLLHAVGNWRSLAFLEAVKRTQVARWDLVLYSPICLVIGVGTLWLALSRPRTTYSDS